jgi:putative membrane protein
MPPTLTPLDSRTKLALDRTFLARERTMMAWVRTAASMITFGFSLYKFFQLELGEEPPAANRPIGAREFALVLIGIGLGSLMLAFVEHRASLRVMRAAYGEVTPRSIAGMVGGLIAGLGTLAIVLVIFRQ